MKPFELIFEECDRETRTQFCRIKGYLDAHTVLQFDAEIENLLASDVINVVFDLSDLHYISSSGIGSLMGLTHRLNDGGGELVLIHLSHKVDNIFDLLGFNKIFKIASSREAAAELLGNHHN